MILRRALLKRIPEKGTESSQNENGGLHGRSGITKNRKEYSR
jgi:hypothetical protein